MPLLVRHALRRAAVARLLVRARTRHASTATDQDQTARRQVIFSGIQPTGIPHLGNYLGALRQWVNLQNNAEPNDRLLFSVVDLHAITMKQDPAQLHQRKDETFASLMAVGIDPDRSTMFMQSSSLAHTYLMWLLSCNASMGYLSRMTQWKSKLQLPDNASPLDSSSSSGSREALKLGLFAYPVLQAADILLYGTTHVPVGEDQAQHLEFTREIASGFNHVYGDTFPVPSTIISPAKRVMSLKEPTKKMSKSDSNPASRIHITDPSEVIQKKINGAVTDSIEGISYNRATRSGVSNLIDIMYYMNESVAASPEALAQDLKDVSMRALKEQVAKVVDTELAPIREKYEEIMARSPAHRYSVRHVMLRGGMVAKKLSKPTMDRVQSAMGLRMGREKTEDGE